ncbi:MAG: hypothetical protein II624_07845 [Prevotella sp.]|nr:hypothetical protein [Prevotella sp.]
MPPQLIGRGSAQQCHSAALTIDRCGFAPEEAAGYRLVLIVHGVACVSDERKV